MIRIFLGNGSIEIFVVCSRTWSLFYIARVHLTHSQTYAHCMICCIGTPFNRIWSWAQIYSVVKSCILNWNIMMQLCQMCWNWKSFKFWIWKTVFWQLRLWRISVWRIFSHIWAISSKKFRFDLRKIWKFIFDSKGILRLISFFC